MWQPTWFHIYQWFNITNGLTLSTEDLFSTFQYVGTLNIYFLVHFKKWYPWALGKHSTHWPFINTAYNKLELFSQYQEEVFVVLFSSSISINAITSQCSWVSSGLWVPSSINKPWDNFFLPAKQERKTYVKCCTSEIYKVNII